jgi:hypothetical protein
MKIQITFQEEDGPTVVQVKGAVVTIRRDELYVDGEVVARKWGTPRGPWMVGGKSFAFVRFEVVP